MDKNCQKKMLDLIRSDFITMNGGKNNTRVIAVLITLFFGGLGFMFSPIVGLYVPFLVGTFFVPMLFQNEMKYHSEKLFSLLPIERKDLVRSRFVISVVLYIVFSLVFYFLMLISLKIKPYYYIMGEEAEHADVIMQLAQKSGTMTELGIYNLLYFAVFSIGLMILSGSLKKYFNDSRAFEVIISGGMRRSNKKENFRILLMLGVIAIVIVLVAMIISGYLPIGTAGTVILQLIIQLASAANGFLLGAVLLTIAVMTVIYKYICTVLEYDEKEL
ncbi:MAG: ABC-2 transporter permease [Oscillospiraceae bacterium]